MRSTPSRLYSTAKAARAVDPWARQYPYRYWNTFATKWSDEDRYAHLNNTEYIRYADSIINRFLLTRLQQPSPMGLMVSSSWVYSAPLSYPDPLRAALAIEKIGTSSVTWRVGIFAAPDGDQDQVGAKLMTRDGEEKAAAFGSLTHVFVDPVNRRSKALEGNVRSQLEQLLSDPLEQVK